MTPGQRAGLDPMADSFVGFSIAQLIFAAIGVLAITGEYSSGLIRTTFAAVPARGEVLAAKAAVVSVVTAPCPCPTAAPRTARRVRGRRHASSGSGCEAGWPGVLSGGLFGVQAEG
jgi:hypothetical protein